MTEDSQNFEQLRRLLVLKRHEVPPPGYFHQFSREIILRIKAGELGEAEAHGWAFDGSWLKWLWTACERRPVLAGGASVALCGFFAAATFISASGDVPAVAVSRNVPSTRYVSVQTPLSESAASPAIVPATLDMDFPGFVRPSGEPRVMPSLFNVSPGSEYATPQSTSFPPGN
jgi:hypothetical protein